MKQNYIFCFSWGSGANPWGDERDDKFSKPNHWDGMLEVVGVTGVVHLGQIQSGLRSAIRIVQVSKTARGRQSYHWKILLVIMYIGPMACLRFNLNYN